MCVIKDKAYSFDAKNNTIFKYIHCKKNKKQNTMFKRVQ